MKLKYKLMLAIITVAIGICLMTYQSYALWVANFEGGENIVEVGCFSINFQEITSPVALNNTYPMSDQKGMSGTAYQFTITNTCTIASSYQVTLNTLTTNEIAKEKIKYAIYKSDESKPTAGTLFSNTIKNNDLSNINVANLEESFLIASGNLKEKESVSYNYYMWINETAGNEVMNQSFEASINIVSAATTIYPKGTDHITELAKTDTTNLAYDNTTDNNLRYIGANPNNYVTFNNELWRIIGVMNNIDDGTGKKASRLKLIRNESIGDYSWDSSPSSINKGYGVNEWSQADLNVLLNDFYYNARSDSLCYNGPNNTTTPCDFSEIGLSDKSKTLIDTVLWSTGAQGSNDYTNEAYGLATHFYQYERSLNTGKICNPNMYCNDAVSRTTTWSGKIGLMYPSDYGYATSGGTTTNREACLAKELSNLDNSSYSDCKTNDWLYDSLNYQWTIMPFSNSEFGYSVFRVDNGVINEGHAYVARGSRPTLFLKPEVIIVGGNGTVSAPYQLG